MSFSEATNQQGHLNTLQSNVLSETRSTPVFPSRPNCSEFSTSISFLAYVPIEAVFTCNALFYRFMIDAVSAVRLYIMGLGLSAALNRRRDS